MEENNTSDFTLYILLSVSGLLVVIDGLELLHIIYNWQYGFMVIVPIFEKCIKYELISKTVFSIYSFTAAFSAFSLTLFLLAAEHFFITKFVITYLQINYFLFGPLMAALSLIGIYNWEEMVYVCDKNNFNVKEVSVSNSITIIGCFLISVFLTMLVEFFESTNFLLDSILKRETGSRTLGNFFWVVVSRTHQGRVRSYNGHNTANNQNNNNNNHNSQSNQINIDSNSNTNSNTNNPNINSNDNRNNNENAQNNNVIIHHKENNFNQDTVLNLNNNNEINNKEIIKNFSENSNIDVLHQYPSNYLTANQINVNFEVQGNLENERLLQDNYNQLNKNHEIIKLTNKDTNNNLQSNIQNNVDIINEPNNKDCINKNKIDYNTNLGLNS